jgi:NADH-quinone oxidoreductase subunit E
MLIGKTSLREYEIREIESLRERYPVKQALIIDALMIVQKRSGWISDELIKSLADFLDFSVEEIDSVATFYNLIFRKPVGKHKILICSSLCCWLNGSDLISENLKKILGIEFGGTTSDGQFTLIPIQCLGMCDKSPAMMIDEDSFGCLKVNNLTDILESFD